MVKRNTTHDPHATDQPHPQPKRTQHQHLKEGYLALTHWSSRRGSQLRRLGWTLFLIATGIGMLGLGVGGGYFMGLVDDLPRPNANELRHALTEVNETSRFIDRNAQSLSNVTSDLTRHTLQANHISQTVKEALIATEDEHFATHPGIVPSALIRRAQG